MAGLVDEETLTPYYRRSGKMDSIECSFVANNNCRQARLIDSRLNTFVFS
jgi:tRNA(His) 5'-end guanylyltransferase